MDENENTFSHDTQFTLSYELLCLLRWLATHDQDRLKKIIARALDTGLHEELKKNTANTRDIGSDQDVQNSIVDFLGLLEVTLFDAMNEHTVKRALQKNLMPAIDQIDTSICDNATVRFSVEKALSTTQSGQETPKELLLKELLKRWKPNKKTILN
jgi:hypothetical protein